MQTEIISVDEAKKLFPLIDESYFVGAIYDPIEGPLDPYGVTHAYAKSRADRRARRSYRTTRVTDLVAARRRHVGRGHREGHRPRRACRQCRRPVGARGRAHGRARAAGARHGAPVHHHRGHAGGRRVRRSKEMLHVVDFEGEIYMRQERGGMLIGTYERAGVPWSEKATPWDFGQELLPPTTSTASRRRSKSASSIFRRFERAGIKKIINGPFTFAPDGNPLVGPMRGLRELLGGLRRDGGLQPGRRRRARARPTGWSTATRASTSGRWTSRATATGRRSAYTNAKVRENYSRRFRIRFPNEELPAARPLRTTPIYDRLKARERRLRRRATGWSTRSGSRRRRPSRSRTSLPPLQRTSRMSRAECRAVRERRRAAGDSSYREVRGHGRGRGGVPRPACMANRLPRAGPHRAHADAERARQADRRLHASRKLGAERFFVFGSGPAENYHMRWFDAASAGDRRARRGARGTKLLGLSHRRPAIARAAAEAGPTRTSRRRLPVPGDSREMDVGPIPAIVGRDHLHRRPRLRDLGRAGIPARAVRRCCWQRAQDLGLGHFGARALNSLRLEKSFGTWAREYRPIYGPYEAGLGRFVDLQKNDFIGRDAAAAEKEQRRRAAG